MIKSKFYLKHIKEDHTNKDLGNVLFFWQSVQFKGDPSLPPTIFDNKATRDHIAQYQDEYGEFKKEHPEYQCAWPELEVHIVAPSEEVEHEALPEPETIKEDSQLEA